MEVVSVERIEFVSVGDVVACVMGVDVVIGRGLMFVESVVGAALVLGEFGSEIPA